MEIFQQNTLRSLVIETLSSVGGRQRGDSIWVACPFHAENKPSLSVHIGHKVLPGSFKCFGCNAHGNWNVLAKALSLPLFEFSKTKQNKEEELPLDTIIKDLKNKIALNDANYKILNGIEELPEDFSWRGYTRNFYTKLNAKYYWDDKSRSYLYFPLYMNQLYMGYTLCSLDGKDIKYQTFTDTRKVFFLYDHIPCNTPIVLVEGHFDALRLYAEGFFPLGLFGCQNWSEIKKNYLIAKAPLKIIIAFDGDKAGYDSAVNIFKDLRICCNVDIFYLPIYENAKIDPGSMSQEFIHALWEKVYE